MADFIPTDRTQVKRLPKRGVYSRDEIYAILDEGFVCHVGFVDAGQPYVIPTNYARRGDEILLHGSAASRMLRGLETGIDVCVTVTLVDGLVLARSAFHHSMNYRCVVAFGTARKIDDRERKIEALRVISEHLMRGRWADVRGPAEQELKATAVLEFTIEEASAKMRTGGPKDDADDYALPVWAGVLPVSLQAGEPIPDGVESEAPEYLRSAQIFSQSQSA